MIRLSILSMLFIVGCSTTSSNVVAPKSGSPTAVSVPMDGTQSLKSDNPSTVIIVENYHPELSSKELYGRIGGTNYITASKLNQASTTLAIQIRTALIAEPSFSVVEESAIRRNLISGMPTTTLRAGESGPFVVRFVVTEYDEQSEAEKQGSGITATDILLFPWRYVEFWINVITGIPTRYSIEERKGHVGLDISVFDSNTGRMITSFPVHGTSIAKEKKIGSIMSYNSKSYAGSTLQQATRMALREAIPRIKAAVFKK